jgi:hypothetical protein
LIVDDAVLLGVFAESLPDDIAIAVQRGEVDLVPVMTVLADGARDRRRDHLCHHGFGSPRSDVCPAWSRSPSDFEAAATGSSAAGARSGDATDRPAVALGPRDGGVTL